VKKNIVLSLALALATLATYWPAHRHSFVVYDDSDYISSNVHVTSGLTAPGVAWAFTSVEHANWFPLTRLSWMADWSLFGNNAGGHHMMSVAIHTAAGIVLFLFLAQTTGRRWPSAAVAALFLLHPLHVEAVAWSVERCEVLSTLFFMLALAVYAWYARRPCVGRYAVVCAMAALSLMSKQVLMALPAVLLLMDWWPLGRWRGGPAPAAPGGDRVADRPQPARRAPELPTFTAWRLIVEKLPLLALVGAIVFMGVRAHWLSGDIIAGEALPFGTRLTNATVAYVIYLYKTVAPMDLAVFYPYVRQIPITEAVGAAAALAGVSLLTWLLRRRRPYLAVGWFWYLGVLLPVSGVVVQVGSQAMADRYTYVPLVGIFIAVLWLAGDAATWLQARSASAPRWQAGRRGMAARWAMLARWALVAVVLAAVAACAVTARAQLGYWASDATLFQRAIDVTEGNYNAYVILAGALNKEGRYEAAAERCREALRLKKDYPDAIMTLGMALSNLNLHDQAARQFRWLIERNPTDAAAMEALATVLMKQRKDAAAVEEFTRALALQPDRPSSLNNLAWILATSPSDGVRNGRRAIELALHASDLAMQRDAGVLDTLAAAYAEAGRFPDAVAAAERAMKIAGEERAMRPVGASAGTSASAGLVEAIRARLALYRAGRPYHDAPPAPAAGAPAPE